MSIAADVRREIARQFELVTPPKAAGMVVIAKAPAPALLEARWRFQEALDAVPRDQAEVNRLRLVLDALERPADGLSELHRRGRIR